MVRHKRSNRRSEPLNSRRARIIAKPIENPLEKASKLIVECGFTPSLEPQRVSEEAERHLSKEALRNQQR